MAFKEVEVVLLPDGRMDRKNAALYMGISEKSLSNMAYKGQGPRLIKRGRCWYFKSDLDEWLSGGAVARKPLELVEV